MEQLTKEEKLLEIEKQRNFLRDSYRNMKKYVEDADEELYGKTQKMREMAYNSTFESDTMLQSIYDERESLYSNLRRNHIEFDEYIDEQYNKEMLKLDDEEYEIKSRSEDNDREEMLS